MVKVRGQGIHYCMSSQLNQNQTLLVFSRERNCDVRREKSECVKESGYKKRTQSVCC